MDKKQPKKIIEPFGFVGGQMLQDILSKGASAVTEDERAILRSRISYLTEQQIKDFGVEDPGEEEVGEVPAVSAGESAPNAPTQTPETVKEKKAREKAEKEAAKAAKKNKK